MTRLGVILLGVGLSLMAGCTDSWNNPYPGSDTGDNVLYSAFSERPKHLDPARSYSSNEVEFTGQIYEPPLQYHFLKRPYTLIPLTAEAVPKPRYFDTAGKPLPDTAPAAAIAESVYEIRIRPGIRYQPHPAGVPIRRRDCAHILWRGSSHRSRAAGRGARVPV